MNQTAINSMMNPIRIKIIQELTLKKEATTKEIQLACGNIPQATLYRHLSVLVKSDIIQIASYNQVRGILEKVYTIKTNPSIELNKDFNKLTKEDLSLLYSQFTIGLLTDFEHSLSKEESVEQLKRKIGFQSSSLLLTDEELVEMMRELGGVIQKRLAYTASEGRFLRKLSHIVTTS